MSRLRELKNVIEHAAVVARGNEIGPEHLSKPSQAWEETSGDIGTLEEATRTWAVAQLKSDADVTGLYERWLDLTEPPLLEAVLNETSGNRVAASAKLGIHRTTLRQKLRRHGLDDSKDSGS